MESLQLEKTEQGHFYMRIKKLLFVTGTFTVVFVALILVGIVFLQLRQAEQRKAFEEQLEFIELSHSLNVASNWR